MTDERDWREARRGLRSRRALDRPSRRPPGPRPPFGEAPDMDPRWHPHADVMAVPPTADPRITIMGADGELVAALDMGAHPLGRTPDGQGLLVAEKGAVDLLTIGVDRGV